MSAVKKIAEAISLLLSINSILLLPDIVTSCEPKNMNVRLLQ